MTTASFPFQTLKENCSLSIYLLKYFGGRHTIDRYWVKQGEVLLDLHMLTATLTPGEEEFMSLQYKEERKTKGKCRRGKHKRRDEENNERGLQERLKYQRGLRES